MIPSNLQIRLLRQNLEQRGIHITEDGHGKIKDAINSADRGKKLGFEAQLRTAKAIVDRGVAEPSDITFEPDVKGGDVDILVRHNQKKYHLQVGAKNFYDSDGFFPTAHNKVEEFYNSIKDSPYNAAYDLLYTSAEEITGNVTKLRDAPGSAARVSFEPGFFGYDEIRSEIASKLGKASNQLEEREDALQYNVAVIGADSFLAAGDDTYYRLTLDELREYPRDYMNLDLILIQSIMPDLSAKSVQVRLLPLRNPAILPDVDTHVFGETKNVQLYNVRFTVFPYHISEPGEHTIGIKNGRLHVDGHTGPKII